MVKRRTSRYEQLDLFRPRPDRPAWTALPEDVRNEVLELLARILTQNWNAKVTKEEPNDE